MWDRLPPVVDVKPRQTPPERQVVVANHRGVFEDRRSSAQVGCSQIHPTRSAPCLRSTTSATPRVGSFRDGIYHHPPTCTTSSSATARLSGPTTSTSSTDSDSRAAPSPPPTTLADSPRAGTWAETQVVGGIHPLPYSSSKAFPTRNNNTSASPPTKMRVVGRPYARADASLAVGSYPTEEEVRQCLAQFQRRVEQYECTKRACSEGYLMRVERNVDQFLMRRYPSGDASAKEKLTEGIRRARTQLLNVFNRGGELVARPMEAHRSGERMATQRQASGSASVCPPPLVYHPHIIPDNYIDRAPRLTHMASIRTNHDILREVLRQATLTSTTGGDDLQRAIRSELMIATIREVWKEFLDQLNNKISELLIYLDSSPTPILAAYRVKMEQCSGIDGDAARIFVEGKTNELMQIRQSLSADLDYLEKIHAMDSGYVEHEGQRWREMMEQERQPQKQQQLSHLVPVYGLILSRLHRLEMEHRTVLELYGGTAPCR